MSEAGTLAHRLRRMSGRDPDEHGRASTPLELLFDLTFVVAVGQAANLFAHSVFEGHTWTGLIAFAIAVFAIIWAWINFSWFASAFDTDDWVFRVVTMVQMVGVCIAALGLPALFHSIDEGGHVDNRVLVIGYVVMRLAMVSQWLRAARQSPPAPDLLPRLREVGDRRTGRLGGPGHPQPVAGADPRSPSCC